MQTKQYSTLAGVCLTVAAPLLLAQTDNSHQVQRLEEIIVTTPFEQTAAETALPVGSLSGEELREKVANSLGDTLRNEIGISSSSFGPGIGHPVIRGQSGNRVSVLSNGVGVTDASNQSPDHAEGIEAALADRIEVIRGPATLLYGSGAVGGVINVIDQRIPDRLVDRPEFFIEQSHNTVNDQNKTVVRLDTAGDTIAFHFDAFRRDNENVNIPGFALDLEALEEVGELLHNHEDNNEVQHEEEHEGEHGEFDNTRGYIGNSDSEAEGGSLGLSWVTDRGFIGFSFNSLDNNYGLPLGTHSHVHEEGEHVEEYGEEGHEEEHDHGDVEFVRIDMEKTRYDIKSRLDFADAIFDSLTASIGVTDYEHREMEYFDDGDVEVGTRFTNQGLESRFTLTHSHSDIRSGVWGLQLTDTEFGAVGEEAFIPESQVQGIGLFGVERFMRSRFTGELGLRYEWGDVEAGSRCDNSENALSVSASALYDFNDVGNIHLGLSRSQRAATVEELYSNIDASTCREYTDQEDLTLHAATNLLEIGDANLGTETATNIEFGYRHYAGPVTGQFSVYHNRIDDYIFLDIVGEEFEELPIARYSARDATFTGVEGELSFTLMEQDFATLEMKVFGDLVHAGFDRGGDVPRIPAAKFGAEFRYYGNDWSMHLHATRVDEQDHNGVNELPTDGYTLLSFYGDYHWVIAGDSQLKLFVRGDNLLDEKVRNHASFLKNYAPEPGRGFTLGVRFDY